FTYYYFVIVIMQSVLFHLIQYHKLQKYPCGIKYFKNNGSFIKLKEPLLLKYFISQDISKAYNIGSKEIGPIAL
ncbi:MAG TPA: hypothetical protein VHF08_04500, partial [Nitrososphaeraceae archaeon]|nr:hypothetical protein [Nitrososphaeraceae archaeon]